MALKFFEGLGQTVAGGVGVFFTLGLNDDVIEWTGKGAEKIEDNAEKAWGKDGEVTQFIEAVPGITLKFEF